MDAHQKIATLVKNLIGIDLSVGKESMIDSRLSKRIQELGFTDLAEYENFLNKNPAELKICLEHLTTHKTDWFREIVHFQWLKKQIKHKQYPIHVWSAASSNGLELYSILFLLLKEGLHHNQFRLLGTDISERILDEAIDIQSSEGFLNQKKELLRRVSNPSRVEEELNLSLEKSVKFKKFNLVKDVPNWGLNFDYVFLRNVLIYFDQQTIELVVDRLTQSIKPGGCLILSLTESLQKIPKGFILLPNSIYKSEKLPKTPEKTQSEAESIAMFSLKPISKSKTKILIVEDSTPIQKILLKSYGQIPNVEVVAVASTVKDALKDFKLYSPNFVSLDMKLPDGLGTDFLAKSDFLKYSKDFGGKCVLVTDCSENEGNLVLDALSLGATSYIQKPHLSNLAEFAADLKNLIFEFFDTHSLGNKSKQSKLSLSQLDLSHVNLIVIGSSTGGTEIVRDLIGRFNPDVPPIVVVQHMPASFTGKFADRIQKQTRRPTIEIRTKAKLEWGKAYLAQGGKHAEVVKRSDHIYVDVNDHEPVNRFKPSVSVLFNSVLDSGIAEQTLAIMLTGMGSDGANEMLKLKQNHSICLGQLKETCTVYGMPRAAEEIGALSASLSPDDMIELVNRTRFTRY